MQHKNLSNQFQPQVCIIIVNWNGGDDTIECLETLIRIKHQNFQIVVCDNQSSDSSVEKIQQWASGQYVPLIPTGAITTRLITQRRAVNPSSITVTREAVEFGSCQSLSSYRLLLVKTGDNLGYAGANNIAMRYVLNSNNFDYVWLVNNDAVVDANSLSSMLSKLNNYENPAICGSKILFYDRPSIIQALGGSKYNRWTGISSTSLGRNFNDTNTIDHKYYESQLSYIVGASCLIPLNYIADVGLMSERYFLYGEEIDWSLRAAGRYDLVYAEDSKVYHKEGVSVGSPSGDRPSSLLSDFYIFRNKLRIVKIFNPLSYPIAYGYTILQAINRIRKGKWRTAILILKILFGKSHWQQCK